MFKDGRYIGTKGVKEVTKDDIVKMMVGRDLDLYGEDKRLKGRSDEVIFEVKNLKSRNNVRDVSFSLKRGEILGMFGMVGSGRTETAMAAFGEDEGFESGDIYVKGKKVIVKSSIHAVKFGIGLVPENRVTQGVILNAPIKNNITLPFLKKLASWGVINGKKETDIVRDYMGRLKVKAPNEKAKVRTLSGGNQQKVSIAKWLASQCDIIIFDEPTHGIDVGAKHDIYELLRELSDDGKGVIMISSELPEILHVCDRILVFRDGTIIHEFKDNKNLTEEDVVTYALG